MQLLTVEHLGKTFKHRGQETHAVSDLSFSLDQGRTLGLLGPNGAGKTTTLRVLATVSRASRGTVCVAGLDLAREARRIRQRIGYVPQAGTLLSEAVVGQELVFQGELFGMARLEAERRGREVLESMGARGLWDRRAGRLSGGERRKVDIAIGMMNHPAVAFLDEPTVGLDPDSRGELWSMIRRMREEWGTTVVLTTHYLDEAEDLADEILLLENGRALAHDSTERLSERFAVDEVAFHLDATGAVDPSSTLERIGGVERATFSTDPQEGPVLSVRMRDGGNTLPVVLRALDVQGQRPKRIDVKKGGLQDAFFTLTGNEVNA